MTIAIGVIDDVGCTIVADGLGVSACVKKYDIAKIDSHLGITFAVSGVLSGKEIMREALDMEMERTAGERVSLVGLSNKLRQAVESRGWHPDSDRGGDPPHWSLSYLLTDGHSLAVVYTCMAARFVDGSLDDGVMDTIGSGNEMAEGVYRRAIEAGVDIRDAARDAIRITSEYSVGCGGKSFEVFTPHDKAILVP